MIRNIAEQDTMIVTVRAEAAALPVQQLDVSLEHRERERIERQQMLSVFGLAV
jgi:hypothetical protein